MARGIVPSSTCEQGSDGDAMPRTGQEQCPVSHSPPRGGGSSAGAAPVPPASPMCIWGRRRLTASSPGRKERVCGLAAFRGKIKLNGGLPSAWQAEAERRRNEGKAQGLLCALGPGSRWCLCSGGWHRGLCPPVHTDNPKNHLLATWCHGPWVKRSLCVAAQQVRCCRIVANLTLTFFVQLRVSAVLCQAAGPAVPETSSVAQPRVLEPLLEKQGLKHRSSAISHVSFVSY